MKMVDPDGRDEIYCREDGSEISRQLPTPPPKSAGPAKVNKRRHRNPEEQIAYQRTTIRWLAVALIVAIVSFIVVAAMLLWVLEGPNLF